MVNEGKVNPNFKLGLWRDDGTTHRGVEHRKDGRFNCEEMIRYIWGFLPWKRQRKIPIEVAPLKAQGRFLSGSYIEIVISSM